MIPLADIGERRWLERADVRDAPRTHDEYEHLERYRWAATQVRGRVLDIACGTGYGAARLSGSGATVTGVDCDADALHAAHAQAPAAQLVLARTPPVPFGESEFDFVVSFETVEHVERDAEFLTELHRVLVPGGELLLSTPNRAASSPNLDRPANPYHVREYLLPDLQSLLTDTGFTVTGINCQRPERRRLPEYAAMALLARVPRLCQPGRWWDDLAHGMGTVEPWTPASTHPLTWVIKARRPG